MNLPHRRFLFVFLLVCLPGTRGFTLDVDGKAPKLGSDTLSAAALSVIQTGLDMSFKTILTDISTEITGISSDPRKLIRGFADASVFTSTGASQRAYEGYKYVAFTVGPVIGARLSGTQVDFADEFSNIGDELKDNGDVRTGFSVQAVSGQLSINTSPFLLENLYLGLRFGYFDFDAIDNLSFKTLQLGIVGNYQLVRGLEFTPKVVAWRGIGFATGFIFQQTNLKYSYALDTYTENFMPGGSLRIDPELVFNMDVNTFVVPLEINTAFRVLFLNFNLGLGMDLAFGKNDININMAGEIDVEGADIYTSVPGSLVLNAGGNISPTVVNPKVMMGLGFTFGPVVLDIPITYFFLTGHGLSVGITAGIVW
jgi:hypothetical protein